MKNKIYITKGLPASGKSTWAKEMVRKSRGDTKRINKDDLRAMIDDGEWSDQNERFINQAKDALITAALNARKDVIIDDTNLHPKMEKNIRKAFGHRANIEVIFFNTKVEECIRRDARREGSAHVGEEVIQNMWNKWNGGWKDIDCTDVGTEFDIFEQNDDLPTCALFDIDGTIAHNTGTRSPYDWKRVGEDEVVHQVADLINMIATRTKVIIFSGRDAVCRPETEKWLADHGIYYDALFMRPEGDSRKDTIVKSEMLDQYIAGQYYVEFVIDDRPSVCRMWRERGIFTFQVGDPHKEF